MPNRLPGVVRHQPFEAGLRILMLEMSLAGAVKDTGEFRPSVRAAHIDNTDRQDARRRRVDTEQARGLTILHAPPELALGRKDEMLIEWIGVDFDLHPL